MQLDKTEHLCRMSAIPAGPYPVRVRLQQMRSFGWLTLQEQVRVEARLGRDPMDLNTNDATNQRIYNNDSREDSLIQKHRWTTESTDQTISFINLPFYGQNQIWVKEPRSAAHIYVSVLFLGCLNSFRCTISPCVYEYALNA